MRTPRPTSPPLWLSKLYACQLSRFWCVDWYTDNLSSPIPHLAAVVDEGIHGLPDSRIWWLTALHLSLEVVLEVRPHHVVVVSPFIHSDLSLGLDDCVDSPNYNDTQGK